MMGGLRPPARSCCKGRTPCPLGERGHIAAPLSTLPARRESPAPRHPNRRGFPAARLSPAEELIPGYRQEHTLPNMGMIRLHPASPNTPGRLTAIVRQECITLREDDPVLVRQKAALSAFPHAMPGADGIAWGAAGALS